MSCVLGAPATHAMDGLQCRCIARSDGDGRLILRGAGAGRASIPNCTCRMQDIQRYEETAREADASIERIARIFAEMGVDAATMEKVRSIRSAADAEKEKYRKMAGALDIENGAETNTTSKSKTVTFIYCFDPIKISICGVTVAHFPLRRKRSEFESR